MAEVQTELSEKLQDCLARLPKQPGVYLLKDHHGTIIYVGKAKNLFSRVRSYFTRGADQRAFVALLDRLLGDVETIVTTNEKEALLLENTLIKKHKPRFNIMLRDDKNYLVLRLDPKANYPRLEVTRRIKDDDARYFGPYHSATACRQTLRVVNRHFQLRTCTDRFMKSRTRPCLQYQIGRCPAPCVLSVDKDQYQQQVDDVSLFLKGRGEELILQLEQRMHRAADALNFEHATQLRNQISAIQRALLGQHAVGDKFIDQDVFGFHRQGDAVDFAVLNFRHGKLVARQANSFSGQEFPDEELLSSFVNLYYDRGAQIPDQVLIPIPLEDIDAKQQWLSELRGLTNLKDRKVTIVAPQRGTRRRLVELAQKNAASNFSSRRQQNEDAQAALTKLQQRLHLQRLPHRIECYDISGTQGEAVVGSMVTMTDGQLDRSGYRNFRVKQATDDFSSVYQVLSRRFRRARQRSQGWELPDLIVIDGGKGQLSSAIAARKDILEDGARPSLADTPETLRFPELVGLAKERELTAGQQPDRIFLVGVKDPIKLRPNTSELYLLTQLRDEAHRVAIRHHKRTRRRQNLRSILDDIPGIGSRRKTQLLKALGSTKRIRYASIDDLTKIPGMTARAAEAVAHYFGKQKSE